MSYAIHESRSGCASSSQLHLQLIPQQRRDKILHIFPSGLFAGGSVICEDPIDNLIATYGADLLPSYSEQATYNDLGAAATAPMSGEDMLRMSVPGNPGEDYPIYAEVPETAFLCDGQVCCFQCLKSRYLRLRCLPQDNSLIIDFCM